MLNAMKSLLIVGAGIAVNFSGWAQDLNAPRRSICPIAQRATGTAGKEMAPLAKSWPQSPPI